jgi:translation initiation factor 4G
VVHAVAHKFLQGGADLAEAAQEEKLELDKFFGQVQTEASALQKALDQEKAKNAALESKAKAAVGELKHAKAVFAEELHKVESRVQAKVKNLGAENTKLKSELSRAKLAVALHAKTEEALRARLAEIGKVFSSQETAVENIIAATSNVESKLPQAQDVEVPKVEAKAEEVDVKADVSQEAKVEETKVDEADTAVETKTDDVKMDDVKVDDTDDVKVDDVKVDDAKVDDAKVDDAKVDDAKVEDEKKDAPAVATTVALTHHKKEAAVTAKTEDLDLVHQALADDKAAKEAKVDKAEKTEKAEKSDKSDMDNIKSEVDALDKEVDDDSSSASAVKSDSAQMLGDAGDALNKLLKS